MLSVMFLKRDLQHRINEFQNFMLTIAAHGGINCSEYLDLNWKLS